MQKLILAVVLSLFLFTELWSQCTVSISSPKDTVVCGDCVQLSTFGRGQGPVVFQENFNSGSPSGWAFTQQATFTNPCSPNGVDGSSHIWMGNNSGVPRTLQTQAYNFTPATSGATICFDMLFAAQGGSSPCEGPDEPQEGVFLQYQIGNGPWVTINYFDPNGGSDPQLINWTNWCFPLPPAALTAGVSIRWFQDADSGADYDHWGIDNVQIFFNDPTFTIDVGSGGGSSIYTFPQGSSGGAVPTLVCPIVTRTYSVVMSNSTGVTCRDSVRIVVRNPTIEVNAGQDVSICQGQCTTLNATANVIKSPAKTPTYSNTQLEPIQAGLGSTTQVNINVRGLNMDNVLPGSITSVCITNATYFGFNFFPPGQVSIADLNFYLVCPDGNRILLVPSGVTVGTQGNSSYTNTCFVIGGGNIANGTSPYTGNFAPNQPFNGLVGCTANGVWSIEIENNSALGFGAGTFSGWSITFDDPEISYTADFSWSPTTNMTGATTLSPSVCPTTNTTYTLTASDTAGCVTVTDQVAVTVTPTCCNLQIGATTAQPTCGSSNGSISITTPQGVGPYTFLWNDNNTTQNRTGLAAGTYRVTVTDNGQTNCTKDTVITLNNPGTLSLTLSNPVNPACGASNGSITVAITGGTAPYTVVISDGVNAPQTINVPVAITQPVNNLPAGNYSVTVTDAANCQQTQTINLVAPNSPTINSLNSVIESCAGANDGRITVVASGGTGTLTYLWSNSQTSATINNLSPGQYSVTVRDASNCTVTSNATLIAGPACCNLSISATTTSPTCGATDGGINLTIVSGSGSYAYIWSNTATTEDLTNIAAGSYSVTITDNGQANCTRDTTINLTSANGPTISNISATNETCLGDNNGSATVTASGGTGILSYLWSNSQTTATITGLTPGNYLVTVTDAAGCIATGNVSLVAGPQCCNLTATIATTSTTCNAATGSITATIDNISGTAPFTVVITDINNSANTNSLTENVPVIGFSGLAGGTYTVVITDVNSCIYRDTVDVTEDNNTIVLNINATNISCFGLNDGAAQVIADGNSAPFIYNWSNTATTDLIDNLAAGTYNVTVTDQIGCFRVGTATITEPAPLVVNLGNDLFLCNGESATLDAANAGSNYLWSTGDTTQTIVINTSGTYSIEIVNNNSCTAIDTIEVIAATVLVDAGEPVTIIERDTADLNAITSGDITQGDFVWTPATYLSCTNCQNPSAIPPVTTTYSVTYIDDNGCPANDTITVTVLPGEYYFYMPNAFSPNEDGENDIVFPIMEGVKQFTWRIWNRWGQMMYECVNNTTPCSWDGKVNGKLLDPSVFVWEAVVEFKKPSIERYKGSITLVK
jgi:gliding motility-associated-like protein